MPNHVLHVHLTQASKGSAQEQQYQLYLTIKDDLQLQQANLSILLALKIKFEGLIANNTPCRSSVIRPRNQDDHHDDAHPEGENSVKRQKISEHGTYVIGESSSGQANESDPSPSTSSNQEQLDDFDFWTDKYATDDDELPAEKSLHKFLAIIFPDDDIEERTSRWVDKYVKKFNPYAQYSVEYWKNPHGKIFYIKRQKEPGKPIKEVCSNSKIVQVIKTTGELGHEHKFVTKIIVRRANGRFSSITKLDYKKLNKNDIKDMYLLCVNSKVDYYAETGLLWSLSVFIRSTMIWERVHDLQLGVESYQQNVNLIAPTITFPGIEKKKMFSIITELIHGIIYKNIKKEKRVMEHHEIHKFCD
ncbi:hypothetical protein Tco_0425875 [Tanacetum coccineum]